jgi:hypothetical protein
MHLLGADLFFIGPSVSRLIEAFEVAFALVPCRSATIRVAGERIAACPEIPRRVRIPYYDTVRICECGSIFMFSNVVRK